MSDYKPFIQTQAVDNFKKSTYNLNYKMQKFNDEPKQMPKQSQNNTALYKGTFKLPSTTQNNDIVKKSEFNLPEPTITQPNDNITLPLGQSNAPIEQGEFSFNQGQSNAPVEQGEFSFNVGQSNAPIEQGEFSFNQGQSNAPVEQGEFSFNVGQIDDKLKLSDFKLNVGQIDDKIELGDFKFKKGQTEVITELSEFSFNVGQTDTPIDKGEFSFNQGQTVQLVTQGEFNFGEGQTVQLVTQGEFSFDEGQIETKNEKGEFSFNVGQTETKNELGNYTFNESGDASQKETKKTISDYKFNDFTTVPANPFTLYKKMPFKVGVSDARMTRKAANPNNIAMTKGYWTKEKFSIKNGPLGGKLPDVNSSVWDDTYQTENVSSFWKSKNFKANDINPLTFNHKNPNDVFYNLNGIRYDFKFDKAMISVSQNKNIITSKIINKDGTVKEYIGLDDYEISIDATIWSGINGVYPYEKVENLVKYLDYSLGPIAVENSLLNDFYGINYIIINSYELAMEEGSVSQQKIKINAKSDNFYSSGTGNNPYGIL